MGVLTSMQGGWRRARGASPADAWGTKPAGLAPNVRQRRLFSSGCLPQRRHVEKPRLLRDLAGDEALGDRVAVVMQDRYELLRIDAAFVDEHHLELSVAVLLDDEHVVVRGDEFRDFVGKRKAADPHLVEVDALLRQR